MTQQTDKTNKARDKFRFAKIHVRIEPIETIAKPDWIRVKASHSEQVAKVKQLLREHNLHSVCEEASCPNISECFGKGTATFMIMGDLCTRRCSFCDVAHGKPKPLDVNEPANLAKALGHMNLKYIVITSVDRDDLKDGGALHFAHCINEVRKHSPETKIEILVPDFRKRMEIALDCLATGLPDVFNHNVETVERLYKPIRPGSVYQGSLDLLKSFKQRFPHIPTKSGLMLGLGEKHEEVLQVIQDLRAHNVDMLTVGQYLQPSKYHAQVQRYATLEEFAEIKRYAETLGFANVASGALVRSSYHADLQASGEVVGEK
jgi:lipoic acid synthetase